MSLGRYEFAAGRVNYDSEQGVFTWRKKDGEAREVKIWNAKFVGSRCGCVGPDGYVRIAFTFSGNKTFRLLAHRLAWFIVYGSEPKLQIDHINQNKADNRIANLRDVAKEINQRNVMQTKSNTSGITGVSWNKKLEKWSAQVQVSGKNYLLGRFTDIKEAEKVVKEFRAKHGFTEQHGQLQKYTKTQQNKQS